MPYVVYVNKPTSKARVHSADCREYQSRQQDSTPNGYWTQIFPNFESAWKYAQSTGKRNIDSCSICREQTSTESSTNQQKGSGTVKDISPEVTLDDLTRWRRGLIRLLDEIDGGPSTAGVVSRIRRLSRLDRIPREVAPFMIAIAEMRNVSEYQNKRLSHAEGEAIRHAWTAVAEWARAQGIELKP